MHHTLLALLFGQRSIDFRPYLGGKFCHTSLRTRQTCGARIEDTASGGAANLAATLRAIGTQQQVVFGRRSFGGGWRCEGVLFHIEIGGQSDDRRKGRRVAVVIAQLMHAAAMAAKRNRRWWTRQRLRGRIRLSSNGFWLNRFGGLQIGRHCGSRYCRIIEKTALK